MKKLLILDSNSILNRGYYGVRFLSTKSGTPTNAVYGFLSMMAKLLSEQKPDYVCAAFDLKAPTFRHKLYKGYKAQRTPMPEELKAQLPIAKDVVRAMNIPILELEGYEADDIIGTVSRICEERGVECFIATGDKDDLQLASELTKVILTVTRRGYNETTTYDIEAVKERYGVTPRQFIDVKALMGDMSDNIPGINGIGEKTATELIARFGSIENLYDKLDTSGIIGVKLRRLTSGKDAAFLSKRLSEIVRDVPIEFDMESCAFTTVKDCASDDLYPLLKSLELNSIIKRFDLPETSKRINHDSEAFKDVTVTRPDGLPELSGRIALLAELNDDKEISYLAAASGKKAYFWDSADYTQERLVEILKRFGEDETLEKVCFDAKELIVSFNGKIAFKNIADDVILKAYLADSAKGSYTIPALCEEYLNAVLAKSEKKQLSLFDDDETADERLIFAGRSAAALLMLNDKLGEMLKELDQLHLYYDVEMPLLYVLAEMQTEGMLVDAEELDKFGSMLGMRINETAKKIYEEAGEKFNINSPKQLGTILFEKLGLPAAKKTKSGYSTNAEVLEKLKTVHPIAQLVIDYRQYSKLKTTYCDALRTLMDPETHRIHSIFNQTVTVTGRISSAEPNMQNIPTRTELGRELRKMFVAKEGCMLVDADYSQIELRILANVAHDEAMISAFKNNEDIHAVTASQIFGVPISRVTREQRGHAKTINFGIIYGMSDYTLAQDLKISVPEAKFYTQNYFKKYHGVREYMDGIKEEASKTGCVKTLLNRVRRIPELSSSNHNVRAFGERAAMNTPIQGSAADIIKLAMVKVHERLRSEGLKAKLILQVHDELIVEAPEEEVEAVKRILKEEMENAVKLDVPLVVDMAVGKSWYETK